MEMHPIPSRAGSTSQGYRIAADQSAGMRAVFTTRASLLAKAIGVRLPEEATDERPARFWELKSRRHRRIVWLLHLRLAAQVLVAARDHQTRAAATCPGSLTGLRAGPARGCPDAK